MKCFRHFAAATIAVIVASNASFALSFDNTEQANWPAWRGPNSNGFVKTANPPLKWSEQENIKWKVAIEGEGSSTPIVWNEQVFVLSAIITDRIPEKAPEKDPVARTRPPATIVQFVVWCLDRETGNVNWKKVVHEAAPHEGRHSSTTYAASSPVTDGKHLYVLFGSYGVYCLEMNGKLVWRRDLGKMRTRKGWGEAVSPSLYRNRLVVNWDQEDQSQIYVLDTASGKTVWEKTRDEPTTWATPLIVAQKDQTQVITNGTNLVRSYDLESGNIIWESKGTTLNAIPCPILYDNQVICMGGYRGNSAKSIPINSKGDVESKVQWTFNQHTPYVPSPVLVDNRLYFTKSNKAILNCLDAKTGKPVFDLTRMPGLANMYASPVATADKIYFVSREGKTLVIDSSNEFKVLATNALKEGIDASPALAGNQIFLRSKTSLYCIENKEEKN